MGTHKQPDRCEKHCDKARGDDDIVYENEDKVHQMVIGREVVSNHKICLPHRQD